MSHKRVGVRDSILKTIVFIAKSFWQIQHIAPNSGTVAHSAGYEQSGLD